MNADGSGQVDLTNTPAVDEFTPEWSPDGTKSRSREVVTTPTST